jgi:hypothetical protein
MHQSWALSIKDPTIDHYRPFYFIGLKKVSYLQYRNLYDGRPLHRLSDQKLLSDLLIALSEVDISNFLIFFLLFYRKERH